MLPEGAEPGLRRFIRGELVASAINLQATDDDLDANINMMQSEANLHDAVLIGFSKREVGLVVASGNPLGLASVTDIPIKAARIAAQPDGSGPQILLERLLKRADVALSQVTFASAVCPTGPDVAQAVRLGRADCGFAIRAIANAIGLSFIPIAWERFDLVVRQHDYFRPQLQTFLRFLKSPALAARASEMGGYDISGIGEVRFAP
jgi:molybdate-binding protein